MENAAKTSSPVTNSHLTVLTPLLPVETSAEGGVSASSTTTVLTLTTTNAVNTSQNGGILNAARAVSADQKSGLVQEQPKPVVGLNVFQLPIVVPLEAASGELLQMSSSCLPQVHQQRQPFMMPAVGSDIVSCSDSVVDLQRVAIPQQLSPHHPNQTPQAPPHHHAIAAAGSYENQVTTGRGSPPGYPGNSTYATLTPFQPLPPISTVSDKFNGAAGSNNGIGFVFMPNHSTPGDVGTYGETPNMYTQMTHYKEMVPAEVQQNGSDQSMNCSSFETSPNGLAMMLNNSGYLMPQQAMAVRNFPLQYSAYGQAVPIQVQANDQSLPVKSEMNGTVSLSTVDGPSYDTMTTVYSSNLLSASSLQPKGVVAMTPVTSLVGDFQGPTSVAVAAAAAAASVVSPRLSGGTSVSSQMRVGSPDQPSSSTDMRSCDDARSASGDGAGGEEINTRDVALRVSNELKKYSIPQAVFAQRVLGRSQGTLSDLLRNPKPWSKLKSGRETFRRMWKWLQEPEYQRMSALRTGTGWSLLKVYFKCFCSAVDAAVIVYSGHSDPSRIEM